MSDNIIEVTHFGDWLKANVLWENLSRRPGLLRDAARGARVFAERYKNTLIKGILTNGAYVGETWVPVSDKYGRFKERTFGVSRSNLLYASGNYLTQLQTISIVQKDYLVDMGFSRGALNSKSHRWGLTLQSYSKILEYGSETTKVPPRPLWAPAFIRIRGYSGLIQTIEQGIGKRLRKYGITFRA